MSGVRICDRQILKGLTLIVMENEHLRLSILPEKGADIYEFTVKPAGIDLLWKSPFGLRNPTGYVPPGTDLLGNFIELYEGGWQDVFPNGGAPCQYKGARLGLNGEVCNLPWEYRILETGPDRAAVVFETITYQTPFSLEKKVELVRGEPWATITEEITNLGREPMDFMWGQHLAFDGGLLRSGGWRLAAPAAGVETNCTALADPGQKPPGRRVNRFPADGDFAWPAATDTDGREADLTHFPPQDEVSCDILYLKDLRAGFFGLVNRQAGTGFALTWPRKVFPYLWCWRNFNGSFGYPWYGRADCVALEPFTSYPALGLAEAVGRKTHRTLQPGETISASLKAVTLSGEADHENLASLLADRGLLDEDN